MTFKTGDRALSKNTQIFILTVCILLCAAAFFMMVVVLPIMALSLLMAGIVFCSYILAEMYID